MVIVTTSTVQQTPDAGAPSRPRNETTFRVFAWNVRGSLAWNSLHAKILAPINLKPMF